MGSQLKKIRRALPPPPAPPNVHASFGSQRYSFRADPPPRPAEVTISTPPELKLEPVTITVDGPPLPAFKVPPRPALRSLLPLLALGALAIGPSGGRDGR
jgi:hypothetical protein